VSRLSRPPSQPFICESRVSGLSLKPSTDRIVDGNENLIYLQVFESLLAHQVKLLGHAKLLS
jgi:hypothetical protein